MVCNFLSRQAGTHSLMFVLLLLVNLWSASPTLYAQASAPTTITASKGTFDTKVEVKFTRSASAIFGYLLFRSTSPDADPCAGGYIAQLPAAGPQLTWVTYNDTTANPGQAYYYSVRSSGVGGGYCTTGRELGWRGPPSPLTGVLASDDQYTNRIELTWQRHWDASRISGVHILRKDAGSGQDNPCNGGSGVSEGALSDPSATSFPDTGVIAGRNYSYAMKVQGPSGSWSACSNISTGSRKVSAPTNVTANYSSATARVSLAWTSPTGATSFRVYRSQSSNACSGTPLSTVSSNSFTESGALSPGSYNYSVSAAGINGRYGLCSAIASVVVPNPAPPPTPTPTPTPVTPPNVTVNGRVQFSGGLPLSGVGITLSPTNGGNTRTTVTAADGSFSIAAVTPGNYRLRAQRTGYTFNPPEFDVSVSSNPSNLYVFNAQCASGYSQQGSSCVAIVPTYSLSGRITLDGAPVSGVILSAGSYGTELTDSDGRYSFGGIAQGASLTVTPSLAGYVFTPPSASVTISSSNASRDFSASCAPGFMALGTQCVQHVEPLLNCVARTDDGAYVARFGYRNQNAQAINIAIGAMNEFSPAPANRGQPTSFDSGLIVNAFEVLFDGSLLSWNLGSQTVSASAQSTACDATPLCNAGGPYNVTCQGAVTTIALQGNASINPLPGELSYLWSTNCPSAMLQGGTSAQATLSLTDPGNGMAVNCTATLLVSNGVSQSTCNAAVNASACTNICSGTIDPCGVCNGTSACVDCAGVPHGTGKTDRCGVCNGDGKGCLGCVDIDTRALSAALGSDFPRLKELYLASFKKAKRIARKNQDKRTMKRLSRERNRILPQVDALVGQLLGTYSSIVRSCLHQEYCKHTDHLAHLNAYRTLSQQLKRGVRRASKGLKRNKAFVKSDHKRMAATNALAESIQSHLHELPRYTSVCPD